MNPRTRRFPLHASIRMCALILLAGALAPATSRAASKSFSSGSIILPMSIEYQSNDGIIAAYSLVYSVLYLNQASNSPITIYLAIAPNKLSPYRCDTMHSNPGVPSNLPNYASLNDNDGCDFVVQRGTADGGQPVSLVDASGAAQAPFSVSDITYDVTLGPKRGSGTHAIGSSTQMVKYLGGSFVIDSTDATAFLALLQSNPGLRQFHADGQSAKYVNLHRANHDFSAPVASVLKQRPPPLALVSSNGQTDKLTDVLVNSGLCGPSGFFVDGSTTPCAGIVYDDFTSNPALLLGAGSGDLGRLNNTNPSVGPVYGLLWLGDGAFGNNPDSSSVPAYQRTSIEAFLAKKGNVFAEYNTVGAVEFGRYQTTDGVQKVPSASAVAPNEDCNDSAGFSFFRGGGSNCVIYKGTNLPFAQSGNFYYQEGGNGNWEGYQPIDRGALKGTFLVPPGTTPGTMEVVREASKASNGTITPTGTMIASASYYLNDSNNGLIMYLAGHKYSQPPKYWGERIILNTLLAQLQAGGTELARSEPVAYVNSTSGTTRIYQGTYVEPLTPDVTATVTYDQSNPTIWQFPYVVGHLYQYDLSTLLSTAQAFSFSSQTTSPDAGYLLKNGIPMPQARQVWTFVAGSGNVGWSRIDFKHTQVLDGCAHASSSDGVCHLSKALLSGGNAAGIQLSQLQSPSVNPAQAKTLGMLVSQIRGSCAAFCQGAATCPPSAVPQYEPADSECDPRTSSDALLPRLNRARLGGIDHGSAAVVGPSRYLSSAPWDKRPVVAYAGGNDGMLHAFYVSDWNGGTTGSWPGGTGVTNFGSLTGKAVMQELWAIVPPGQIGFMYANSALVDGSMNVVDVFGDFPTDKNGDGVIDWSMTNCTGSDISNCERPSGIRTWRTVLIATAGKGASHWGLGGSEMFALDVTNPLHPILLWHIGGATENDKRSYDASANAWVAFDSGGSPPLDPTRFALKWSDTSTTDYSPTSATAIAAMKTGRYDYSGMGLAFTTAVAKVWSGVGYQYTLFVATNAAGFAPADPSQLFSNPWYTAAQAPGGAYRGVEVFAVDIITGQKMWQWEHLYSTAVGTGVDNSVPPRLALGDVDQNGSTDRIYVGDLEGRLWELSSRDGRNYNYLLGSDAQRHSLPLFGTPSMTGTGAPASVTIPFKLNDGTTALSQQPLTTPIGQGRFTAVPADQRDFLVNRLVLLAGTMGVDWPIAPYEKGHIYVIPVSPDVGTRLVEPIDMSAARDPRKFGILRSYPVGHPDQTDKHAWWDLELGTGERVYGMPRVSNNQIIFNTAFGSFSGDISSTVSDRGNFWSVVANSAGQVTSSSTANNSKSLGGAVVVGTSVVVTTDNKIKKVAGQVTPNTVNTSPFNRATPAAIKTWEVVPR